MANWNIFLIAVAHGKVELVKYLIDTHKVSVRQAGQEPGAQGPEAEGFCLKLAVKNQDQAMLSELWGSFVSWDIAHLELLMQWIIEEKWGAGLKVVLPSYTTDVLFSCQTFEKQHELAKGWLSHRPNVPQSFSVFLDQYLSEKPFAILTALAVLEHKELQISVGDARGLL